MSGPLPSALRARFQQYIEEGPSGRTAALRLELSPARGSLGTPGQDQRSRRACASRPDARYTQACPHRAFFEEPVRQDPDIAFFELRRKCREVFLNNSLNVRHIFGFRPWIYWASELLRNYSDDKKSELVDLGFFLSVRESTRRHLQRNRNTAIDEERMAVDKT